MTLTQDDGSFISLEDAKNMVSDYKNNPEINLEKKINSHYFGKNKLLEVINQKDSIGARIYHGKAADDDGDFVQKIIVVGVDKDGNDILNTNKILDFSSTCPPHCPPPERGL